MRYVSVLTFCALVAAGSAFAQTYPSKTLRIVTSAAGGTNDFMARLLAPGLTSNLGQQVIVVNQATIPGIETAAKSAPDGYTMLIQTGALWIGQLLQKVSYDVERDFQPVTLMVSTPLVLVVHPSLPVKSVKELIALAKARPGELNYSSGSIGGTSWLSAELLKAIGGVSIVHVPYTGASVTAVLSGETQLTFESPNALLELVKSGRLRALGITSLQPSALAPGLPPLAASGLPGYESVSAAGVLVPAKTPDAIIRRLNQEVVRIVNQPDVKQKLAGAGYEVVGNSPEQFAAIIKSDVAKWSKITRDLGIKAQ